MPRETGGAGKQVQLPKEAAVQFFGIAPYIGASEDISLVPVGTTSERDLTLTLFSNNTNRLSINELDYRDRPCLIVFHPLGHAQFEFEIISQSVFPDRYRQLLHRCIRQTRAGSRRWVIL